MSSSTVLARKWRPRQFADVIGQEPVVRALSQALSSGRLHHAYLFTGTRGVGKTTLARIFAKALNCRSGLTADPCQDDIAQAIDAGNFVDLIEIDAASRTKVEDTRELLDNIHYAPSIGRYRIYLIDEVHMLSTHSFNALLKTLEEPPEHVKFLLATTDPHKLPVTVLSRCLQFHLRPMTLPVLSHHLAHILTAEQVSYDESALTLIARMSGGSVRDALSLLDQAIMLGNGSVQLKSTQEMLGLASDIQLIALLEALARQDTEALWHQLQQWVSWGADFDRLQQQLLEQLHQIALVQSFAALADGVDAALVALAQAVSSEQVQLWLQVALLAQDDMRLAPTAQMGFELMLMRLMHFVADQPVSRSVLSTQTLSSATPTSTMRPSAPSAVHESASVASEASPPTDNTQASQEKLSPYLAALAAAGIKKVDTEKKTLTSDTYVAETAVMERISTQTDDLINNLYSELSVTTVLQEATSQQASIQEMSTTSHMDIVVADDMAILPTVYPAEHWQQQIAQWQLTGPALALAQVSVRLQTATDDRLLCLACDPQMRSHQQLWQEKLTKALARVAPTLSLSWSEQWSDTWITPTMLVQQQQEATIQQVKAQMMADPRLQHLSQQLHLSPQWSQLTELAPESS